MPLLPSHTLLQAYTLTLIGCSYLLFFSPLSLLNSSPLWLLGESMHVPRASFVPASPNIAVNPSAFAPGVTLEAKKSVVERVLGSSALLGDDIREALALLGLAVFLAAVTQGIMVTPLYYSKGTLTALAHKSKASKHDSYTDTNAVSEFAEKIHTLHTTQTLFLTLSALRVVIEGTLVAYIYLGFSDRSHKMGLDIGVGDSGKGFMGLLANRIVFAISMADMLFWGYIWTVLREEARDIAGILALRRQAEDEGQN